MVVADLSIAMVAPVHDVLLIHYDSDFEIDANVISVRHQWVVDRGTVVRFGADREVLA